MILIKRKIIFTPKLSNSQAPSLKVTSIEVAFDEGEYKQTGRKKWLKYTSKLEFPPKPFISV